MPPDPPADGALDWPPATRDIAIERARQARLEEGGLPVDDATLERLADAAMDPERSEPDVHYTPEEYNDEIARDRREAVSAYLRSHPEVNGGVRLGWRRGRRTLYVSLVGEAAAHQDRLREIAGDRVTFEQVPRTVADLDAVMRRLFADRRKLRAAGFQVRMALPDRQRGAVEAHVIGGSGAAAAEECFAARYGHLVAVRWLGPSRLREVPHPFGSWTSEDRRLRVFFGLDRNGQQRGTARVGQECEDRIVIALTRLEPVGFTTLIGGFHPHHAELELSAPVGGRAVIDASTGAIRPSLAELRAR